MTTTPPAPGRLDLPDADVLWQPRFLAPDDADRLFAALMDEVPWAERAIVLFGKRVLQPRLVAWLGDRGVTYTYSRTTLRAEPWTPAVREVRARVMDEAAALGMPYAPNGVLLNRYRTGQDAMGWHADDERALGRAPIIASVSLGETRRFSLRRRDDHTVRVDLQLAHGSVLWMRGDTQRHWQHALPRTSRPRAERINLTFRQVAAVAPWPRAT